MSAVEPSPATAPVADGSTRAAAANGAAAGARPDRASAKPKFPFFVRFAAGVLVLGAGLVIAVALIATRKTAHQTPVEEVVRRVDAIRMEPRPAGSVARMWEGFGTARPRDQADLSAEVGGRVVYRSPTIDPGVRVRAGDVLVRIDESDYAERLAAARSATQALLARLEGLDVEETRLRDQVARAQEQIDFTIWEIERVEQARAGAAATDLELVRLRAAQSRLEADRLRLAQQLELVPSRRQAFEAELAASRNDEAMARRQVERATIASPIDGVLQRIDAHVGEVVQPGRAIARVVGLRRIEIPLRIAAGAQAEIEVGEIARVRPGASAQAGRTWNARVARIAPEADAATRTIFVFLEVDQDDAASGASLLMPGQFVTAHVPGRADAARGLFVVPRRAVAEDRVWVTVLDQSGATRAQPRPVTVLYHIEASMPDLDPDETQWAVIGSGLKTNDYVIVSNLDDLFPGARVRTGAAEGP
ncbi:MAG: efflux RND transporter periplasmic adaptor subunit [Phycisphaeraceae bacterium]|nr:efflux RND transporter periplasmic adaptor subunit [Phycisphaeraceae bacterium]MBX3406792.1 efflux RND transporter periplasmic adaptor subunit [Phycisphaeraceae bacterium]